MTVMEAFSLAFPFHMLIIFIVCLVLSAIGFYNFVYFMSVGYGLSIAGSGVTLLILYSSSIKLPLILLNALLILYGLRLSGFLLFREIKNAAYRKTLKQASGGDKKMPVFVKVAIWLACSLMYTAQVSPVLYRLDANRTSSIMPIISVFIMALALIIETVADHQKSMAKKINPNRFCDTGLYQYVRCPNYFGEVLFWTGVFLSGFGALRGIVQWIVAILGYLLLLYVMFSGAKRIEARQNKNYGEDLEYQNYIKDTPLILPLLPLYSLQEFDFIK